MFGFSNTIATIRAIAGAAVTEWLVDAIGAYDKLLNQLL
jgi:hypothetical protein